MTGEIAVASCVIDRRPVLVLGEAALPHRREQLPPGDYPPPPFAYLALMDVTLPGARPPPAAHPSGARRLTQEVVYGLRHAEGWRLAAWGYALTPAGWYGVVSFDWRTRDGTGAPESARAG